MPSTNQEQMFLELVNDARMDPLGNAARFITSYSPLESNAENIDFALSFFGVNGTLLHTALSGLTPAAPLAWSDQLAAAARLHNGQMISHNAQSHQLPGELGLGPRIGNSVAQGGQGYSFSQAGENIYAYTEDPLQGHAGLFVDWGGPSGGMQNPPGHRQNIMDPAFREIGVGVTATANPNPPFGDVGPLVVTQDFGVRQTSPAVFILGVAYNDSNHNHFYSVGEGLPGLAVAVGSDDAISTASGGYGFGTNSTGAQNITLSGGGLSGMVTVSATLVSGVNIKFDVVDGHTLRTSVSATVSGPATRVEGMGVTGLTLTTGAGSQTLVGTKGADTLNGGGGNDALNGGSGNDALNGGSGNDVLNGGSGADTASYAGATAGVTASLAAAGAQGTGGSGTDTISSCENLTGSSFNDNLTGNASVNTLVGGAGNDVLLGGAGNDILRGQARGDTLTGGTGADRFDFDAVGDTGLAAGARDIIMDFVHAQGDKIDLAGIDANAALAGNQAFTFIGVAAFSGNAAGKLRYDAAHHQVLGSTDADTAAEFSIQVNGLASMQASDFVL